MILLFHFLNAIAFYSNLLSNCFLGYFLFLTVSRKEKELKIMHKNYKLKSCQ